MSINEWNFRIGKNPEKIWKIPKASTTDTVNIKIVFTSRPKIKITFILGPKIKITFSSEFKITITFTSGSPKLKLPLS